MHLNGKSRGKFNVEKFRKKERANKLRFPLASTIQCLVQKTNLIWNEIQNKQNLGRHDFIG